MGIIIISFVTVVDRFGIDVSCVVRGGCQSWVAHGVSDDVLVEVFATISHIETPIVCLIRTQEILLMILSLIEQIILREVQ